MYKAYITKITNLRKHSNADRLLVGECFGNNVIVSLDTKEGDVGVYFPVDGKLSEEFATINDLVRRKDEMGNNAGGYLDPDKRNITAIKLRGEKSDGLFMPLTSLSKFTDITKLEVGLAFDTLNGKQICEKYIPNRPNRCGRSQHTSKKKIKVNEYPQFTEHVDTEQLAYNIDNFKKGDICYITLKMHGTSQRTANTLHEKEIKPNFIQRLFGRKPFKIRQYEVVSGTRRVVLDSFEKDTSYYGGDLFRKQWHDFFAKRLHQGEEVFYEVLGYTDSGRLIMGEADNKKTKDKEFIAQYGATTKFTYGCEPNECVAYVYRMTYTSPEGVVIEYPTELVMRRCEEMGIPFVPVFEKFIFTTKANLMKRVEKYYDGTDPVGKTHIREGVVVRIDNRPTFKAYKHKNFNFKVLEGIIKTDAQAPDMEEAQE